MRLCFTTPTPTLLRRATKITTSPSVQHRSYVYRNNIINVRPRSVVCRAVSTASLESATKIQSDNATSGSTSSNAPTFQDAVRLLQDYWSKNGCLVWHPFNTEVGAGTMNPATFLRVLGPEPWSVAYEEPSIRPDDSRYGENPNRLQRHTQFQVIVKPASKFSQELVLGSYKALGIDIEKEDIRFVEDNWASPALGAWGLGWEIWLNGMEITQFTYFQQAGSISLDTVSVEITYGLERIVMALQEKNHFKDIVFADNINSNITYGEIFAQSEYEMSKYNLDDADVARNTQFFDNYEAEALMLLDKRLPVPAYNYLLKASHTFNILDARGAIGVTERARFFQRMRKLSRNVAKLWLERRQEMQFPLLANSSPTSVASHTDSIPSQAFPSSPVLREKEDFVLEIGVEELPPHDLTSMITQVENCMKDILQKSSLSYDALQVFGTPRRVAVLVKALQTKQQDTSSRVRGPPLSVAIDEKGEKTKAALGFLRKQGGAESAVELDEKEGYMYVTVERKGLTAQQLLADNIADKILAKISFAKTMRWNDTGVAFSRPIRWLLCLLGAETIPFEYAGVTSSSYSRSLRGGDGFARDILIESAESYRGILGNEEHEIMLDTKQRSDTIVRESKRLAESIGGTLVEDAELLNEVANLVENPIPILGRFNPEFLDLPQEVLMSVMKKHQRYFSIENNNNNSAAGEGERNKLMDAFITVVNGNSSKVDLDSIRRGNEAVLRARYSDARFFYENDTRSGKKLKHFVPLLDRLTFQERVGSMLDKTNRVVAAVPQVFAYLGEQDNNIEVAKEAALLMKADLATSMVVEMTSLAGIMGMHYAAKSGETSNPEVVPRVIFDAALPRFSGDILPETRTGAILGVIDRLDSLLALFSVGLAPKSTADPFALRRAALGTVQILVSQGISADIGELLNITKTHLGHIEPQDKNSVVSSVDSVLDFVEKRLEGFLLDTQGHRPDVVKATLAAETCKRKPYVAATTARTVQQMLEMAGDRAMVEDAAEVYGRTVRMLLSVTEGDTTHEDDAELDSQVNAALFEVEAERKLLQALDDFTVYGDEGVRERIVKFACLKPVVDAFFDGVFVAAKDPAVRANRVALCARLVALIGEEVDLSLLQM